MRRADEPREPSSDLDRCRMTALRILNFRFNAEGELRRKLRAKNFDSETIESTIARLRDEQWLDDDRYAAAYVRARMQKRIGSGRIRRELQASGVSQESARRAVTENADADRERASLVALCNKRRAALERRHGTGYTESFEGRQKLASYLSNQGYDSALVRSVVDTDDEPSA